MNIPRQRRLRVEYLEVRQMLTGSTDIDCAATIAERNALLNSAQSLAGDLDLDRTVGFADFLKLSANFGNQAKYSQGDVDLDGTVGFSDFLVLSGNFGKLFQGNDAPVATDFNLPTMPRGTFFSVDAADIISEFGTDAESVISSSSLRFGAISVNGEAGNSMGHVGFSFVPEQHLAGQISIDTNAAAFTGLIPGQSAAVAIDFVVSDGNLEDTGQLTFTVSTSSEPIYRAIFRFLGEPVADRELKATAKANANERLLDVQISGAVDISEVLQSFDLTQAVPVVPVNSGQVTSLASAFASNDSESNSTAKNASRAAAVSTNTSAATAFASNGSSAVADARDDSTSQSAADDGSVASGTANRNSTVSAVAAGGSAASSTADEMSDSTALAEDGSAAEASANLDSSSTANAKGKSNASATARTSSTSVADADRTASANSFSARESVASAAASDGSISTAIGIVGSAASTTTSMGSDGLTFTRDSSSGESIAEEQSSASVASEGTGSAAATARASSTAVTVAADNSTATSEGQSGSVAIALAIDGNTANATARDNSATQASGKEAGDTTATATNQAAASAHGLNSSTAVATSTDRSISRAVASFQSTAEASATTASGAQATASAGALGNVPTIGTAAIPQVTQELLDSITADVTVLKAVLADLAFTALRETTTKGGAANAIRDRLPAAPAVPAENATGARATATASGGTVADAMAELGSVVTENSP